MPRLATALSRTLTVFVCSVALGACAPPGALVGRIAAQRGVAAGLAAYESLARDRGASFPGALATVAAVVLRDAAGSLDAAERDAGLAAIRSLGSAGRDVLAPLRQRDGIVGVQATALAFDLEGREGPPPTLLLRALESNDVEIRCASLGVLEARDDAAGLAQVLGRGPYECRRQAVLRLVRLRVDVAARLAVVSCATREPDDRVRAMCIAALGGLGREVSAVLEHAIDDRDAIVGDVAVDALVRVDPARARRLFATALAGPPVRRSIEVARGLAAEGDRAAVDHLLGALASSDATVRAHAAVGVGAFLPRDRPALVPFVTSDDPEVAIRVAAALMRSDDARPPVVAALVRLAVHPDPWVAVRALDVLAEMHESSAEIPVQRALRAPRADVRRLAVIAWSRLASITDNADPLAPLLLDPDRAVRLAAAAEIVRIAAH